MIIAKSLYKVFNSAIGRMLLEVAGPFLGMGAIRASSSSSEIPLCHHSFIRSRRCEVLSRSSNSNSSVVM